MKTAVFGAFSIPKEHTKHAQLRIHEKAKLSFSTRAKISSRRIFM